MSSRVRARKGLSLDRLRAFRDVYEAGGLALAAPGQPGRQSQLSRQVSELEAALGLTLFDRVGRKLSPTAAARRLAVVVRELELGLLDLTADQAPLKVTLGAGDSVLQWLVLPVAAALTGDVALAAHAMSADVAAAAVTDHLVDLALLRGPEVPEHLTSLRLGRVEYALFVPRRRKVDRLPLAVATTEPALAPALASLGAAQLELETFPQVARAVATGAFSGVLPTFARAALPPAEFESVRVRGLDEAAATLFLVWRGRLDQLRPGLAPFRSRLAKAVRDGLTR